MHRVDPKHMGGYAPRTSLARFFIAVAILSSCRSVEPPMPPALRVGALPDASSSLVRLQHQQLIEEVCKLAGFRCAWVDTSSYQELVSGIGSGAIDLAYLGGVTFAQAQHRYGAIPIAIRDVDAAFTSSVVVRNDSAARSLADLRGKRFAFGNEWSTSGAVMPRYFLERDGLGVHAFSRVVFSGRHDATAKMVADRDVDAGAVNSSIFLALLASGDPAATRLRVLWRSPPFTDYVWAVRKELPADVRQRLLDAFLDLDRSVPAHREALLHESARGFLPANADEWALVKSILAERGQL